MNFIFWIFFARAVLIRRYFRISLFALMTSSRLIFLEVKIFIDLSDTQQQESLVILLLYYSSFCRKLKLGFQNL